MNYLVLAVVVLVFIISFKFDWKIITRLLFGALVAYFFVILMAVKNMLGMQEFGME